MTQPQPRWSIQAVDARLADPQRNLATLAAKLDLPAEQVARFAKVRDALLTNRAARARGEHVDECDLSAAGVTARDVVAYLNVGDAIRDQYMAKRWGIDDNTERRRGGMSR